VKDGETGVAERPIDRRYEPIDGIGSQAEEV
jgi:hypothetical protein